MEEQDKKLAKVAKVIDDFSFIINRGSVHDVEIGNKYLIFYFGENIVDPDTREDLGALEIVRGRAQVVHVQERIATLESIEKETIPGRIRKISRGSRSRISPYFGGSREEVIEEGTKTRRTAVDAEIGDFARLI